MRFKSAFAALLLAVTLPMPLIAGDKMVLFAQEDPKMNAAMNEAQSTLDEALALIPLHNGTYNQALTLKVALARSDGAGDEIIWVGKIRPFAGSRFTGNLENTPNHLQGKKLGSKVRFSKSQIADWSISSRGILWGNYTTRVMLPHLPEDEAAYLRTILSKTPLPK